jgi:hypothetical protein
MEEAFARVKRCPNPMPGPCEIEIRSLSVWPRLIRMRCAAVSWNTSSRGRFRTITQFPGRRAFWFESTEMAREHGQLRDLQEPAPEWLRPIVP